MIDQPKSTGKVAICEQAISLIFQ